MPNDEEMSEDALAVMLEKVEEARKALASGAQLDPRVSTVRTDAAGVRRDQTGGVRELAQPAQGLVRRHHAGWTLTEAGQDWIIERLRDE